MYFNVNFNVFFILIKVHLLVSELYIYQNARCNNKKKKTYIRRLELVYQQLSYKMGAQNRELGKFHIRITDSLSSYQYKYQHLINKVK